MDLKTKFFIALLVLATICTGIYCLLITFYAPYLLKDTFNLAVYVEGNSVDPSGRNKLFFTSYLYNNNYPEKSKKLPTNKEDLYSLLKQGWQVVHRFNAQMIPVWKKNDETLAIPFRYHSNEFYFRKTQKTFTCLAHSSPSYWGLIVPPFDCELVLILMPRSQGNILIYPTGIRRNDMMNALQKDQDDIKIFTEIKIPPLSTLDTASESTIKFMEQDKTLKTFVDISENKQPK